MIAFLKNSWIYIAGASLFLLVLGSAYLKGRKDKALEEAIRAFQELAKNVKKRERVAKKYENKESQDINTAFDRVSKLSRKL